VEDPYNGEARVRRSIGIFIFAEKGEAKVKGGEDGKNITK
jgi:hypothetical protein